MELVGLDSEIDTEVEFVNVASIGDTAQAIRVFVTDDGTTSEQALNFGSNATFLAPNEEYTEVTTTTSEYASIIAQLSVDVASTYDVYVDVVGDGLFYLTQGDDNDLSYSFTV